MNLVWVIKKTPASIRFMKTQRETWNSTNRKCIALIKNYCFRETTIHSVRDDSKSVSKNATTRRSFLKTLASLKKKLQLIYDENF